MDTALTTPPPTRELVLEKLNRCFVDRDAATRVLGILDRYGTESWYRERDRVHLAILKQCNGDVERAKRLADLACSDFRDVLVGAEFPEELSLPAGHADLDAVRQRDRQQYEDWLNSD